MYGAKWTGQLVLLRLARLFKKTAGVPIYSPSRNVFEATHEPFTRRIVDGMVLLAETTECLGRESKQRLALLNHARLLGAGEDSIRYATSHPDRVMPRSTMYRLSRAARQHVAECLNRKARLNGRFRAIAGETTRTPKPEVTGGP